MGARLFVWGGATIPRRLGDEKVPYAGPFVFDDTVYPALPRAAAMIVYTVALIDDPNGSIKKRVVRAIGGGK